MTTIDPMIPPPRRTRRNVWALYVASVLLILCGVFLWHLAADSERRAASADRHAQHADRVAAANQGALAQANNRLRELGGHPVPTPSASAGARGPVGPGPSDTQIAAAVANYCTLHGGCTGTPSQWQVTAAVDAFCAAGACRGAAGASGAPGAVGTQGQPGNAGAAGSPGATGPGPTDDQISAAVAAYCTAHGDCTGPAGPKGDAGRGIASIDCQGLGVDQLVIHYDDNTSETVTCTPPEGKHS